MAPMPKGKPGLNNFRCNDAQDGRLDIFTRIEKREKKIPVIILTVKEKMRDLFELEGIKDYIVKPFKSEELLEKINKYFK